MRNSSQITGKITSQMSQVAALVVPVQRGTRWIKSHRMTAHALGVCFFVPYYISNVGVDFIGSQFLNVIAD